MALESRRPDNGPLFRIGRKPDAWAPPDWLYAKDDKTFGNRFDDPEGLYRVLYASSQRVGCFIETMARFRKDPTLADELAEIDGEDDFTPFGSVPIEWISDRLMGRAYAYAEFADIYAPGWISHLQHALSSLLRDLGIPHLDCAILERPDPRKLTQHAGAEANRQRFRGVYYPSRHDHAIENWAIFEPFSLESQELSPISEDDADLQSAMGILQIKFAR